MTGGEEIAGDRREVEPVALPGIALSFAGLQSAAGSEGLVGDRDEGEPAALPVVALPVAGSRSAVRSRIACAGVRGVRVARGIAGCGRARARLVRLVGMSGRAALIEERGFANSGIAVTP
jgi:hypothetical protein